MKKYKVKAMGDYYRQLKEQEATIYAKNIDDAYKVAWGMFPEYKEIWVMEAKND